MAAPVVAERRDERSRGALPFAQYMEQLIIQSGFRGAGGIEGQVLRAAGPLLGVHSVRGLQAFLRGRAGRDFSGNSVPLDGRLDAGTLCALFRHLQDREFKESLEGRPGEYSAALMRLREAVYPLIDADPRDPRYREAAGAVLGHSGFRDESALRGFLNAAGHAGFSGRALDGSGPLDAEALFAFFSFADGRQGIRGSVPRREAPAIAFPVPEANRRAASQEEVFVMRGRARIPLGFLPKSFGEARAGGYKHMALDIHAPIGTEIIAPLAGEIAEVYTTERGGNVVEMRCEGGLRMRFVHLSKIDVSKGQRVEKGRRIGAVGMSGTITPHLHFEVYRLADGRITYLNPLELFEKTR